MRRMRLGAANTLALVLLATSHFSAVGQPPPIRPSIDENSVALAYGTAQLSTTDLVIGQPGAGGLSLGRIFIGSWIHSFQGYVSEASDGTKYTATVSLGDHAESFEKLYAPANSPWVSVQGRASTLTDDSSGTWTYTSPEGAVAVFTPQAGLLLAAMVTSLTLPDGERRTYHYASPGRLQSVTNNRGYQIKLIYGNGGYSFIGAMGINMAVDWCDPLANSCSGTTQAWPTVTYDHNAGHDSLLITDQLGGSTNYRLEYGAPTIPATPARIYVRWPGSQSDNVIYEFDSAEPERVVSVNRNGRVWSYSYTSSAAGVTTVVRDPANRESRYLFNTMARSIASYTNTAGEVTTFQNDVKGRPLVVTLPTGHTIRYQYDARGNVTEMRQTSYPAGSPDLVSAAGYDATCTTATAKKCNKPNWTRDPAGAQTDFIYGSAHGNPTMVTLPAPRSGAIRPVTNYTYTAYQAYYKNSSGAIAAAGTSVYYLTRVAQCRMTSGCSATSTDQLRTDIGYGANSVANNRLPVQSTVRNGSGSLVAATTMEYDPFGNLTATNGPLAGTVDRAVTRYDALRRVIGTVGPDPDGAGPRLHIGARTAYNARGLPELVEIGNLPGQTEASWVSFIASQATVTEFDVDRRATRTSVVAAGVTHAVQQVSFDGLGRIDCSVTRMNAAYFGALPLSACDATADGPFGPDRIARYSYDNADRAMSVVNGYGRPDAITESITYFPGGKVETVTDGKGNRTTQSYDPYGRLYRIYYPHLTNVGSSSTADFEEFAYNTNSQVTATRLRNEDWIATPRDALGRVMVKDIPGTAEDVYFGYDNQGRMLSALYNNVAGNGIGQTYDGLGRLATRTAFGRQLSYQYDLLGRRLRVTHPDGFYAHYAYTNTGELSAITDSTGATLATFGYDELGARTSLTRPNGAATSYVPDTLKRLQELRHELSGTSFDVTASFGYTPSGQIATKTVSNDAAYTWTPPTPTGSVTSQFDGQNQLTNFGGTPVTDDANANVWQGLGSLAYTYDALGQLRQATGGANAVLVDYDPTGMLRRVTVGGTATQYLHDGVDLVAQYNSSGAVVQRFVHGAGLDEPLVVYQGSGTTNKTWLHADERGSIVAASNGSGATTASAKYSSYGESGALVSPFGYTGQLYLPQLDLYYYKARMYSAKAGRFLQPDPIGYGDGLNLYGYVGGDPINARDPLGLQETPMPPVFFPNVVISNWLPNGGWGYASWGYSPYERPPLEWAQPVPPWLQTSGLCLGGCHGTTPDGPIRPMTPTEALVLNAAATLATLPVGGQFVALARAGLAARGTAALSRAGQAADRAGLTRAGRALAKHGGREGSVFPRATGNPGAINAQGQAALDDILGNVGKSSPNKYGGTDYFGGRLGGGARYDEAGNFMGFLEP